MINNDFNHSELTKEKKLWDIYFASRRIPFSRFNLWSTIIVFVALVCNSWFTQQPITETLEIVRRLSETGLVVTLNTLGFLVAGFTIFATITQPKLSLEMAKHIHPDSGLSYLKHSYFLLIRVFIYFITFATFCLLIIIFGQQGGLVSMLVSFSPHAENIKFAIVKITYVIFFTGFYFLLMQLKSYIFNMYHAVMTSLRWEAINSEKEENNS